MGYTSNNLSLRSGVLGGGAPRQWDYFIADSIATVLGAGYISDATKKGMTVGDIVWVFSGTLNTALTASPSTSGVGVVSRFASDPTYAIMQVDSIASGAATLKEVSAELGSQVGFFGATPVSQPAATAQSVYTPTTVTAVATTAITTAVTTAVTGTFGFVTQAQGDAIVAAVNSLISRVSATVTAVNSLITDQTAVGVLLPAIRTALVNLGLIKGSA